jgi:hypothetical protein
MNEFVTIPADVGPPGFHLLFAEVFLKPSVGMTGTRNQVMKVQGHSPAT